MTLPIAIDYSAALTQGGGIGRYTRELIAALARDDLETLYVLFAAQQTPSSVPALPGPNFRWATTRLSTEWLARLWHRARLPLHVERWTGPISLLHSPDFTLPPVRRGTRTLLTVHDLSFVRTPEAATPGLRAYLNAAVPRSVRHADHVLADSLATRQDLIELYQTPPGKISVLYSGVDQRFRPITDRLALQQVRDRYEIGDVPFVLSVGTIQPRKNYERLIEAFRRSAISDLQLVIAGGKGWLDHSIYQQVSAAGMEDRIRFVGFVEDGDLPALYSAAHVFAFPSLYEGFGLPVLEAMACGVPVITSNVSSLPEVVGDAAVSIDPFDVDALAQALERVTHDTVLRRRLAQQGLERASQFTWENAARQLREHYRTLLEYQDAESTYFRGRTPSE